VSRYQHAFGEIGNVIAEAIDKVGKDGVVNVEESQTFGMDLEFTEGMQFDKGYASSQFVTDQDRMEAVLEDSLILIVNQKISTARDLLPVLSQVTQSNKPLLIISDDIESEALAALIVNKSRGTLNAAAVRAPLFGDRRKRMMEDIAILTGGEAIIGELGLKLENTRLDQFGSARKVVVTKDNTTILDGDGDPEKIQDRLNRIKADLEVTASDYDCQKRQDRSAKLAGAAAIIKVGAPTETELREKKHRVEDALSATRAALEEGIVPGGGFALLHAQGPVADLIDTLDDDERTGAKIVHRALEEPMCQISANAGADGSIVIDNVRSQSGSVDFNALSGEYEDLVAAGIIDPPMVTRSALQNAASIGSLVVTTDVVVAEPAEGLGAAAVMRAGMNMDVV
jgi:chaperonin GroEL